MSIAGFLEYLREHPATAELGAALTTLAASRGHDVVPAVVPVRVDCRRDRLAS
jgi:hypothetical protein